MTVFYGREDRFLGGSRLGIFQEGIKTNECGSSVENAWECGPYVSSENF